MHRNGVYINPVKNFKFKQKFINFEQYCKKVSGYFVT